MERDTDWNLVMWRSNPVETQAMGLDLIVLPVFFLGVLLAIAGTVFWIWMLVDCALHEPSEGNDKLVWIVIILFTHILGALIYFFARRPRRLRTGGNG